MRAGALSARDRAEDILWMIRTDREVTAVQIAARMGVSSDAVYKALYATAQLAAVIALNERADEGALAGWNCGSTSCNRCNGSRNRKRKAQ